MAALSTPLYPHRRKLDGSADLICLSCLGTITLSDEEAANESHLDHDCLSSPLFIASTRVPYSRTTEA